MVPVLADYEGHSCISYHLLITFLNLQIMKVILNAVQTSPPTVRQPSSTNASVGNDKVTSAVATSAHHTVERIFDHCQQVPTTMESQ